MEERTAKQDETSPKHVLESAAGEATAATPPISTGTQKASHSLEDANEEISNLISSGKITSSDVPSITSVLKEHALLKQKIDKLKSLLGRSAKAQRETKIDLDSSQKRLGQALREIDRLNQKLEKLQSRPTHRE